MENKLRPKIRHFETCLSVSICDGLGIEKKHLPRALLRFFVKSEKYYRILGYDVAEKYGKYYVRITVEKLTNGKSLVI